MPSAATGLDPVLTVTEGSPSGHPVFRFTAAPVMQYTAAQLTKGIVLINRGHGSTYDKDVFRFLVRDLRFRWGACGHD